MNTGVQRSGATPPAARTANTKPVGDEPGNSFGQGKDMPRIAMAHGIPYVATATVADLHDLERKVERAMELRGPRYLHVFVPCPLGWGVGRGRHDQARPAGQGDRPLPGLRGRATARSSPSRKIRRQVPVEEYLRPQRRYAHLFGEHGRPDIVERLQAIADDNIRRYGLLRRRGGASDERQALRDHARRRLQPRQQDRQLAHRAGRLRRPDAALQRRLPGRREHPGLAVRGGGGRRAATSAPGASWSRTTRSRRSWAGSVTTPARPPATAASSTRRSASTRSSASSATRRSSRAGSSSSTPSPSGKRVLVVGAGPSGLSAAYHLTRLGHAVTIHEAGPMAGGMMRFGIPQYRLPRDVLDAEVQRILDLGVELELNRKVENVVDDDGGGRLRRRLPRRRRPHRPPRLHPRRRGRADRRRGHAAGEHGGRRAAAARPPRRRLRRRRHGDGRGAHREAARRDRRGRRLPPHPRADAGARLRGRGGRGGGRA